MERRNLVYGGILAVLCIAIVTVTVLILQKRAAPPAASGLPNQQQPVPSKPIESYIPEPPLKEGDPTPPPVDFSPPGGTE